MRKQDLLLLSPIFEERETPADNLGRTYCTTRLFEGVSGEEYSLYWACRSSKGSLVKDVAAACNKPVRWLYDLCAKVEKLLDLNLLQHKPSWAYSLVPYAIGLRTHGNKLARAEEYLRVIANTLPHLPLPDTDRAELLGWTLEHLGGVLLHRDDAAGALKVYDEGKLEFNKLAKSYAGGHERGRWKHRAVACALGCGNAAVNLQKTEQALEWMNVLSEELRELDKRAEESAPSFEFRGHRFCSALGEVLRLRGVAAGKVHNTNEAVSALDESVGIMEETTDHNCLNQLVASYLKRGQSQVSTANCALADLDTAERLIDPHEETGVYRVFIGKARAQIYHTLDEPGLVVQHAEAVLPSAERLGLYRQQNALQRFIYAARRAQR